MWEHSKQTVLALLRTGGAEIKNMGEEPAPPGTNLHGTGVCRFG